MIDCQYPDDEFDAADADGPVPVGVHRAQVPAWRSWIPLAAVLIIVPLVAWGAVALLGRTGGSPAATGSSSPSTGTTAPQTAPVTGSPAPTESATPDSPPTPSGNADLTTGVTVSNGTTTTGLAARTGSKLENAGFTSVNVSQGVYPSDEPTTTTIFYASPQNAPAAQAAAQALNVTNVVESSDAAESNPIVVVLRDDYQE